MQQGSKNDYNTTMQEPNTPRTLLQPMLISCGVLALVAGFFVSLTLIAAALLIFAGS